MSTITAKSVKAARRLERARPLRTSSDSVIKPHISQTSVGSTNIDAFRGQSQSEQVEFCLQDLEALHINFNNGNFDDHTVSLLVQVCNQLKSKGQQLDLFGKEHLDRYFVTLRNASRDERLDMHCRLRLLEIIEMRAMKWKTNENLMNYYKQKLLEMETPGYLSVTSQSATVPYIVSNPQVLSQSASFALTQGEVLRSSGKFVKPTKIPGKNFYKDEIIIRNSDSGKVSPGARDRLVQITGPNDESISQAKVLIDDTIRRNASPVRQEKAEASLFGAAGSESSVSLNSNPSEDSNSPQPTPILKKTLMHSYSMGDASLGEYTYSVCVGADSIRISGSKVDLVQTAKLVLEEYFAGRAKLTEKYQSFASSNSVTTFDNAFNTTAKPEYGLTRQESLKFDANSGDKVNRWLMRSNSGVGKNGPVRSSSSEEETYKGEGSPTDEVKSPTTKMEFSAIDSPVTKKATLYFEFNQGSKFATSEKNHLVRNESLPKSETEDVKIKYTRDFLLECARSPCSRIRPKDTDLLSAEAAALIKESPQEFFDPFIYKEDLTKPFFERLKDSLVRSPQQSLEQ